MNALARQFPEVTSVRRYRLLGGPTRLEEDLSGSPFAPRHTDADNRSE
jgi:hypothetical protein